MCHKVVNFSANRIIYFKFIEIEKDLLIVVVDFLTRLQIYSIAKEEIFFSFQIRESNTINSHPKFKSYRILANNQMNLISKDEIQVTFYYFMNDSKIIEFKVNKIVSQDKLKCDTKETSIKFKCQEFETERTMIKKIILLDEYLINNQVRHAMIDISSMVSISYEK